MFKIEKDIPIEKNKKSLYPFAQMNVNDSFVIPATGYDEYHTARSSLSYYLNVFNKKSEKPFKIKTAQTKEGLRVWRIA